MIKMPLVKNLSSNPPKKDIRADNKPIRVPVKTELTHEEQQMLNTFRRIRERDEEANYIEKRLRKENVSVTDAWEQYQTILNLAMVEEKKRAEEEASFYSESAEASPGI